MMDLAIIPECYVDTNLIETLVPPSDKYNHQKGCGTVAKVMQERFSDRFAVGIIDKDKKEIDYLSEFKVVSNKGSILVHKHTSKHHYIIQISPAIEQFILENTANAGLVLSNFELPNDLELLKRETKTTNSKNDVRFKKLFKALKTSGVSEINRLIAIIRYLKEKVYKAEEKELMEL